MLFATEWEAQRHAAAAAYGFQVFAMPVYPTYDDCPSFLRFVGPVTSSISQSFAQEVAAYRIRLTPVWPGPYGPPDDRPTPSGVPIHDARVVYAVGPDEGGPSEDEEAWPEEEQAVPEVSVLFETPEAAKRHVALSTWMERYFALPVYARYEDCPPEKRYLQRGEPLSQRVLPKP